MSLRDESPWVFIEFLERIVFWVERGTEEEKHKIWKTITVWPLKNWKFAHFTRRVLTKYSWSTRKMPQMHRASFVGSFISLTKVSQNSLCKILEELEISFLIFANRLREDLLATYSQKCLWWNFSIKLIWLFGKTLQTQKWYIKTLSKTNKILKNLFGFDHQAIKYIHITFEHIQSHKWNRHSLNIRLVCCVWNNYELIHSLI